MAHVANLTVDNTKVAANATDFPVYVDLSDMNATFWSTVANGGGDIRIFKSDGTTELAREVVSCDTSGETGELHFKYTGTLSSSVDTEIQIHADGSSSDYAVGATYGRNNVWSGYDGVWHTNESSGTRYSATGSNNFTDNNTVTSATGKVGTSASFASANEEYLSGVFADLNAYGTGSFSISMWINLIDVTSVSLFRNWYTTNQTPNNVQYNTGVVSGQLNHFIYQQNKTAPESTSLDGSSTISTNTWYNVVLVRESNVSKFYLNASIDGTSASNNINVTKSGNTTTIGGALPEDISYTNGKIDEVKIIGSALSADWITTEYNNQNSPSTFYTATAPGITFSITDTLSLSETSTNLRGLITTTSESLSVSETISALKGISFTILDTLGLVETFTSTRTRLFNIAESLGLIEIKAYVQKKWSNISKSTVATVTNGVKTAVSVITNTPKS